MSELIGTTLAPGIPRRSHPISPDDIPLEETEKPGGSSLREDRFSAPFKTVTIFTRAHLRVILIIVSIALLIAAVRLLTSHGHTIPSSQVSISFSPAQINSPSPHPSASVHGQIIVHVIGAVEKEGLVHIDSGSRVADAIEGAGGLSENADIAQLNLAAFISDGDQIVIGTRDSPAGEIRSAQKGSDLSLKESGSSGEKKSNHSKVNLNTADQATLETLPGIGPMTASKIIAWRQENGSFGRIEDLQSVDGIGQKSYAKLSDLVTVD